MGNKDIWNSLKQPPSSALSAIMGGRLKGKTDISPQWRYEAMTEKFGPIGVGWKYEMGHLWSEPGPNDQMFAFAQVALYFKNGDEWSEAIPGIGGSMLVEKETSGPHANDEAYKMAVTDALSVAMKMLGIAADVYAGKWDGAKYKAEGETIKEQPAKAEPAPAPEANIVPKRITRKQSSDLLAIVKEKKLSEKAVTAYIIATFGKTHARDLLEAEATQLIEAIEADKITAQPNKEG